MNPKSPEAFIFRYLSGQCSDQEAIILNKWLDESDEHRTTFASLKKLYIELANHFDDSLDTDEAYRRFLERVKIHDGKGRKHAIRRTWGYLKYAAVVVLFVGLGITAYYFGQNSERRMTAHAFEINVPMGGKSSVVLPDGSSIWLNAGSHLSYNDDFNKENRSVYLEGEALFHIEKNKRPFIVQTSHLDIHVTGTRFNVKSYPDEDKIETTLIEGEIRVEASSETGPIYIKPNQKLSYQKKLETSELVSLDQVKGKKEEEIKLPRQNVIEVYSNVDVEESISWQSGILHIEGETLKSLAKKLERKFDVRFIFEDEGLKDYSYSGTIPDFPLGQVLEAVKLTSPVNYKIDEKTVTLYINKDFRQK